MGCIVLSVSEQNIFSSITGLILAFVINIESEEQRWNTCFLSPIFPHLYFIQIFLSSFILCSYLPWIASIYFKPFSTLLRSFWILKMFFSVLTAPPSLASSVNLIKLIKWKLTERLPLTSRGIGVNPDCLTPLRSGSREIHLLLYRSFL